MKTVEAEVAVAYKDPDHCCNQGSLVRLNNGELLLGFNQERGQAHADSGQSCVIRSFDGGRTWDQTTMAIVEPYTDYEGNWDCAFAQIGDGTIIMHTRICSFIAPTALNRKDEQALYDAHHRPRAERLKRQTGYAVFKSADNGHTWRGPLPVNTYPVAAAGDAHYLAGGTGSGHVVELPDGGLLMPLEGTLSADGYEDGGGLSRETSRCFVLRSDDGGDNWEHWSTMAYDPAQIINFQEPGLTRMSNGRLVCMLRVLFRPSRYDNMWVTASEDDGITWTAPQRTPLWGYPADLIQLQDGRVLAVYSYRAQPMGVRGCTSDDGLSWDPADEFTIADCQTSPPGHREYWHIGYPTVVQNSDGTVVVAYHEYSDDEVPVQYMCTARFELD